MTVANTLPQHLVSIVDRLIARALWGRNDSLRYNLVQRRDEATRAGIIDQSYYARQKEEVLSVTRRGYDLSRSQRST